MEMEKELPEKLILKPKEVSVLLGIGIIKAYQLWKRTDFPGKKLGKRSYFVIKEDFMKWLRSIESPSERVKEGG